MNGTLGPRRIRSKDVLMHPNVVAVFGCRWFPELPTHDLGAGANKGPLVLSSAGCHDAKEWPAVCHGNMPRTTQRSCKQLLLEFPDEGGADRSPPALKQAASICFNDRRAPRYVRRHPGNNYSTQGDLVRSRVQ
jgi:hypothetical protein